MGIEQQLYTRAKRVMFNQSEGYGTIAKSDGISEVFIKERIHPYCAYPAVPMVQNCNVYPPAITVVHYSCGRMLLGQAIYIPADFTGQRSTFFAHNFIFSANLVDDFLQNIEQIRIVKFLTSYDTNKGNKLEKVENLPILGINELIDDKVSCEVLHIINCIINSVNLVKKTYVRVPVEPHEMQDYVYNLLVEIYAKLPKMVKSILGFCTYAREPINKRGVHLIFLEKGAILPRENRDFIIDLSASNQAIIGCGHEKTSFNFRRYVRLLSSERFFSEMEFWHMRMPYAAKLFYKMESEWLNINLDKLSAVQLASIPEKFVQRGKDSGLEIYTVLGILKICVGAFMSRTYLDLRYFLGSYILSSESYLKIVSILLRMIPYADNDAANYENIEFLLRMQNNKTKTTKVR